MGLNRRIAQVDLIISKLVKWRREILPQRFAPWHRISVWSIGLGIGLLASPFWVPSATQIAEAVADWVTRFLGQTHSYDAPTTSNVAPTTETAAKLDCDCAPTRWYHVPATYGGLLIFFGIINYVFFAAILKVDFFVQNFLSTAVQPNDTLESYAKRIARQRGKDVRWVRVTDTQKSTILAAGEVEGNDLGRLLHDALELTDSESLAKLTALEMRGQLEIEGPK